MTLLDLPRYVTYPVVAGTTFGALCFLANRSAYFPSKYPEGFWEQQTLLHADDVWLDTPDGVRIHGWSVKGQNGDLVTIFLHGNAGNISDRGAHFREITAAGSSVLMIDYRGYGKSGGRPSERGLYRDADAAYDQLLKTGFRPNQIVIHGESLGAAVAVDLATRRQCGAVVLEAPFTSAKDVARTVLPVIGPMLVWGFNSREKISRIRAPILFIQGDRDEIIPLRLGQTLFSAAPEPKSFWIVPGAGHNDIVEEAGSTYGQRLRSFYETLPAYRKSGPQL